MAAISVHVRIQWNLYEANPEQWTPLHKGHCRLSQLHRAVYETASKPGTPLHKGQTAGSGPIYGVCYREVLILYVYTEYSGDLC